MIKSKWIGGMSLADVELKNRALKASWVLRLLRSPGSTWRFLAYQALPWNNDLIWECNISPSNIKKIFNFDQFWIQVWIAWTEIKQTQQPSNRVEVLLQILWFNDNILRQGLPWISRDLSEANIFRIQDIYDEDNDSFLTYQQLSTQYNRRLNIMDYNALLAAIPRSYRDLLRSNVTHLPGMTLVEKAMSKKNPAKYLSQLTRNQIIDIDGCQTAWRNDLDDNIDDTMWDNIIVDVHVLTNLDYLRWFQYRLVHRILTTNVRRSKYDSNCTDECTFCGQCPETIIHLFIECE